MSRGNSGRIVLEVDPDLKRRLHAAVAGEGRSLKDWFVEQAIAYLAPSPETTGRSRKRTASKELAPRSPSTP